MSKLKELNNTLEKIIIEIIERVENSKKKLA